MKFPITEPARTTDRLPAESVEVAKFTCWHSEGGTQEGWSTVNRVELTDPDGGAFLCDGYIIRWQFAGNPVFEQTTLDGKSALKEAANKFGWGL